MTRRGGAHFIDLFEAPEPFEFEGRDQVRYFATARYQFSHRLPADGRGFETPGAPACVNVVIVHRTEPHNWAVVGGHVGDARPLP